MTAAQCQHHKKQRTERDRLIQKLKRGKLGSRGKHQQAHERRLNRADAVIYGRNPERDAERNDEQAHRQKAPHATKNGRAGQCDGIRRGRGSVVAYNHNKG